MQYTLLKAKLHHARVTHVEVEYEGSCAIDGKLLDTAGICEYEQIHIYNLNNGERLTTYAIRAEENSGIISLNGAAALKASPRDRVIICAYAVLNQHELANFQPTLVYVDEKNRITHCRNSTPVQVA
ncbi:MAG: aspartate 1-decarboxylase [Gammaproteobacteria bacterium]